MTTRCDYFPPASRNPVRRLALAPRSRRAGLNATFKPPQALASGSVAGDEHHQDANGSVIRSTQIVAPVLTLRSAVASLRSAHSCLWLIISTASAITTA